MPPPTGVVSGRLIPIRYSRNAATVSSGSQEPVALKAFSPASTSFQAIDLPCFAAAASITSCAAGQMSTPVPSPSTKGMIGSSGTDSVPSACIVICCAMGTKLLGAQTRIEIRLRTADRGADRRGHWLRHRLGRGRHRLAVETGLLERLLHQLVQHEDLDATVHRFVGGRVVRLDRVGVTAAGRVDA